MKKKTILTLALAFCLVLALGVGNANAGPSQYYFDEYNNVNVEVSQLGMFFGSQWAILVKVDLSGVPPEPTFGFSFYDTTTNELCLHLLGEGSWVSHSWEGTWAGSGSDFVLSTSYLFMEIHPLWTTPPALTSDSSADPTEQ